MHIYKHTLTSTHSYSHNHIIIHTNYTVATKGQHRHPSPPSLHYGLSLLPPRGWSVLLFLSLSQTSGQLFSQSSRRVHCCIVCDLSDSTDADSLFTDELLRLQADHHHRPSATGYTAFHIWNMDKQMVWEIFQGYGAYEHK